MANKIPLLKSDQSSSDSDKFKPLDENLSSIKNAFKRITDYKSVNRQRILKDDKHHDILKQKNFINDRILILTKLLENRLFDDEDNENEEENNGIIDFLFSSTGIVLAGVGILFSGIIFQLFFPEKFQESFKGFNLSSLLKGVEFGVTPKMREEMLISQQTFTSGPAFEEFKEVVRQHESQVKGYKASYNNWFGDKDPTAFKIGEILNIQTDALASNPKCIQRDSRGNIIKDSRGNVLKSSAIGLYQFTRDTIKFAVDNKIVSKEEYFSPDVQDRIAKFLLKTAGLDRYVKNPETEKEFIKNISARWQWFVNHTDIARKLRRDELKKNKENKQRVTNEISNLQKQDIKKYISFIGRQSLQDEFNRLDPNFKQKIIDLSRDYYEMTGKRLSIQSAYRTEEHNIKVGGAKESRHLRGRAIDLLKEEDARFLQKTGLLKKHGLESLGLKSNIEWKKEIPHIQEISTSSKPVKNQPTVQKLSKLSDIEKSSRSQEEHSSNEQQQVYISYMNDNYKNIVNNINGMHVIHDDPLINYDSIFGIGTS